MKYAILALAAVLASPAMAHPDHDEEVQQAPADAARQHVIRLVTQSKLAPSWSKASVQGTAHRTVNGAHQTVVTFANPAEPAARRVIHVTLAADGSVVSATPAAK